MAATAPKFRSFYPLESSGLMKNGPLRPVFRRKSVFTRRRVRIGGAGGTKVPFRCNSLRRSTPAGPKGRKVPSGPFVPMGPAGALRAPAGKNYHRTPFPLMKVYVICYCRALRRDGRVRGAIEVSPEILMFSPLDLLWAAADLKSCPNCKYILKNMLKTSQELRVLSSVTINCRITNFVMNSVSQL